MNANEYENNVFQTSVSRDAKKGLKQVADVQHKALVCPHFTLMGNSTTVQVLCCQVAHESKVGM